MKLLRTRSRTALRNEAFLLLEATWPVRLSETVALAADPYRGEIRPMGGEGSAPSRCFTSTRGNRTAIGRRVRGGVTHSARLQQAPQTLRSNLSQFLVERAKASEGPSTVRFMPTCTTPDCISPPGPRAFADPTMRSNIAATSRPIPTRTPLAARPRAARKRPKPGASATPTTCGTDAASPSTACLSRTRLRDLPVRGLGRPVHAWGLCSGHYWQQSHGRELKPIVERVSPGGRCSVESCPKTAAHLGLCNTHYQRKSADESDWDRPIKDKAPMAPGGPPGRVTGCCSWRADECSSTSTSSRRSWVVRFGQTLERTFITSTGTSLTTEQTGNRTYTLTAASARETSNSGRRSSRPARKSGRTEWARDPGTVRRRVREGPLRKALAARLGARDRIPAGIKDAYRAAN